MSYKTKIKIIEAGSFLLISVFSASTVFVACSLVR